MTLATGLVRLLGKMTALMAVAIGLTLLPTLPASAQNTQANAPQRCFAQIKNQGLQWDASNPNATAWVDANIASLCAGTPAATYPIDCFAAGIAQGLGWQQVAGLCQFNTSSCAYQSALRFQLLFRADGSYSGPDGTNWAAIIRHCAYGEKLVADSKTADALRDGGGAGAFVGTCSQSAVKMTLFNRPLDQNEITSLCATHEDTTEPTACVTSAANFVTAMARNKVNIVHDARGLPVAFPTGSSADATNPMRNGIVSLCSVSLDATTTVTCFSQGVAHGFDFNTVVEVCRAKPETFSNIQFGGQSTLDFSTVQAMGANCVTANSKNNDGITIDLARGWSACRNQPLFGSAASGTVARSEDLSKTSGLMGTCSKGAVTATLFRTPLDQNDISSLCSTFEDTTEPVTCLTSAENLVTALARTGYTFHDARGPAIPLPTGTSADVNNRLRNGIVSLCSVSLDATTTTTCFAQGLANGFDFNTIVQACQAKPQTFRTLQFGGPALRPYNTVQAMGGNCVTRNALNNNGTIDLARGWSACRNQKIFQ